MVALSAAIAGKGKDSVGPPKAAPSGIFAR